MHIIYIDPDEIRRQQFEKEACKVNAIQTIRLFEDMQTAGQHCTAAQVDLAFISLQSFVSEQPEFILQLHRLQIAFVLVTARNTHTRGSSRSNAIHYLLTSADTHSIHQILEHLQKQIGTEYPILRAPMDIHFKVPERILIKGQPTIVVLDLAQILFFSGSGSYTQIKTIEGCYHLSSQALGKYDIALRHHDDFIRIHRSHIINKRHVRSIERKGRQYYVQLCDNTQLAISSELKDIVFSRME